ncbi:type II toxin-antitoxin system RelE/ParE family toxin [[Mycobacterium] burgundiense]|uniref:Type II toxin-antitoxin system RelE/ParE family toxin n=1 Tax=[Mycobacterium] burgundiense TaxID=3064286 RepID=A0ABM9LLW3_9MYCO|nr:type II toxin-antitoxin system RelE/ParE family toxin [Mycolicibacterium sp. MU0053]CAJ1501295.1 type II toxin-antitoxin system RelE/ParE family toxin [Mycolicibacterium sp. MU0053]
MIRSFKDSDTEKVWNLTYVKRFSNEIAKKAREKLQIIDAAESVNDLRVPPGNRLEKLKGDRASQYSVRVNDQWRICFTWNDGAEGVEICDYH